MLDREWRTLRSFDGGPAVDAYIAGPSALLCAKAYKIHDRLDPAELRRNTDRLSPKDFADLYRLILAIDAVEAAKVFASGAQDAKIGSAVALGHEHLLQILADAATVASMIADAWGDQNEERTIRAQVESWARRFAGV